MRRKRSFSTVLVFMVMFFSVGGAVAQSNSFSYQGSLNNGGTPASGTYDFEFLLFDAPNAGAQLGATATRNGVAVSNGTFAVYLDFAPGAFGGGGRYLEIHVRPTGGGAFTNLTPRHFIGSSPYSIKSLNAETATNATNLGGVAANQFVVTGDVRLSDARIPLPGSGDYVQNRASQQAGTNFNVGGNGAVGGTFTANIVRADTQFNIGLSRVLGIAGGDNTFVGIGAGTSNTGNGNTFVGSNSGAITTTGSNSFFGAGAGRVNTSGFQNAFFGYASGNNNTTGDNNTFYGAHSGRNNTTGSDNTYIGSVAGYNSTGSSNSFFGSDAGYDNTTGSNNSFFGRSAGYHNTAGAANAFFGYAAGEDNTANGNSFFGSEAGRNTTTGFTNSFFGAQAGKDNSVGLQNVFVGSQAGQSNTGGSNNTFVGTRSGDANTTADFNSFFGTFAGFANTTGFTNSFFGESSGEANTTGSNNSFFGRNSGLVTTTGSQNTFIGFVAGDGNTTGHHNTFVGSGAGTDNSTGDFNTALGAGAQVTGNITYGTAIGAGAQVFASNNIAIGRVGNQDTVIVYGGLRLGNPGGNGSVALCRTASLSYVVDCSSSLRYKTNVESFSPGLDVVKRLRPISFNWKDGGAPDVGFGAEEVDEVEPLLATRNTQGGIEGVKYGQITTVLVNAVKEQQSEIERQADVIAHQQKQIDALLKIVCATNAAEQICKERP